MEITKLQGYIKQWLNYHEKADWKTILQEASIPRKGKKWTDAIQYYVRGESVHNRGITTIRA